MREIRIYFYGGAMSIKKEVVFVYQEDYQTKPE